MKKNMISSRLLLLFVFLGVMTVIYTVSCQQDKCKATFCANGGTCANGVCTCALGYVGARCDTLSKNNFIGTWTVTETGTITTQNNYTLLIYADSPANGVIIYNLYNYFTKYPIHGIVNGDTLKIPNQQYQGKVVFGTGYLCPSVAHGQYGDIVMAYEVIDTAVTNLVDDFGVYSLQDHSLPSNWVKE